MELWKKTVLGYLGGMSYVALELIWRHWSHGSMFLVGAICFVLLGELERWFPGLPLLPGSVLGAMLVTTVEFSSGVYLNLVMKLNVWDYSGVPFNLLGQVCLGYFFLWIPVSGLGILLSRWLRHGLFREEVPPLLLV